MHRLLVGFVFLLSSMGCFAQTPELFPELFQKLPENPVLQSFVYTGKLPPVGGHLQGIQGWNAGKAEQLILTGSSGSFAYCLAVHQNRSNRVQQLDSFPFRHAGGCQLAGVQLFVGVEDNIAKDKSALVAVQLNDTGYSMPSRVLRKRSGAFKRSTAGATAACFISAGKVQVAVGDWDTKNLDFYTCSTTACDSVNTIQAPDSLQLPAYQAINLVQEQQRLFLVGFAQAANRNRADLWQIEMAANKPSSISLITSKYFKIKHAASFRYGAGLQYEDGQLKIYATQRSLKHRNTIAVYR